MLETMQKQRQKRISIWVMLIFACLAVAACVSLPLLMPAPMSTFQTFGLDTGKVTVDTLKLSEVIPEPSWLAYSHRRKTLFVTSADSDQRWIYEVDPQTGKVTKWKSGGSMISSPSACSDSNTTWWRSEPITGECAFRNPKEGIDDFPSIAIDSQDNIYLALSYSNLGFFSIPETKNGQIHQIKLVLPESSENPIVKIFPSDDTHRFKQSPSKLIRPRGLTADQNGALYIVDWGNQMIRKIDKGFVSNLAGSPGHGNQDGKGEEAKFSLPYGIVQDSDQSLYITEKELPGIIRKITTDGNVTTFAGIKTLAQEDERLNLRHRDGMAQSAIFSRLTGIVIDQQNNIYVSDTGNHTIRKITHQGMVSSLAGSPPPPIISHKTRQPTSPGFVDGPGTDARFSEPVGLALDDQGILYVADRSNQAIRRIKPIKEKKEEK